jgi:hypothetical protein
VTTTPFTSPIANPTASVAMSAARIGIRGDRSAKTTAPAA